MSTTTTNSTDNNKINISIVPQKGTDNKLNLFSKQSDCSYVSCYCEENVWKLCEKVMLNYADHITNCFAVFVSNEGRTVPLWRQKAGRGEERLVIWDYHVFFVHEYNNQCLVFDLDSQLPFPTHFHKYVTETFRSDLALNPEHHRLFRVVPALEYHRTFASDRRHMLRPDGSWIKPPPTYPPIATAGNVHNLDDFINMDKNKGCGRVYGLSEFVQRFYQSPTNLKN